MKLYQVIWKLLVVILDYNAKRYGNASSRELCRDLRVRYAAGA